MKRLYMIGGPMGVGKTAACRQLQQLLDRSVFLDGDWCWDAHLHRVFLPYFKTYFSRISPSGLAVSKNQSVFGSAISTWI